MNRNGRSIESALWRSIAGPIHLAIVAIMTIAPSGSAQDFGVVPSSGHFEYALLQSMWRAQLYDTAHHHCEDLRSLNKPGTDAHALWTLWWIEGLGRQAVDQYDRRGECDAAIKELIDHYRKDPVFKKRLPWLELQQWRSQWLQAQYALSQYWAAPTREDERQRALTLVRQCLDGLERLRKEVEDAASLASRSASASGVAPFKQLQLLTADVALLEMDFYRVRCECYPAGSSDRLAAVRQMQEAIQAAQARVPADWKGQAKLDLAKAESLLLADSYREGTAMIERLLEESSDMQLRYSAIALLIDGYRKQGELDKAKQWLAQQPNPPPTPELALARLDLLLAEMAKLSESERSSVLKQGLAFKNDIGKFFGGYWQLRAESRLIGLAKSTGNVTEVAAEPSMALQLLRAEAKQLLAAKQWEKGVEKLKQAESKAYQDRDVEQALSLGLERAAILQTNQQLTQAIETFRLVSMKASSASKAPAGHLMAAWLMSKKIADNKDPSVIETDGALYRSILEEHVETWPDDATTRQALPWLDRYLLSGPSWKDAGRIWSAAWDRDPTESNLEYAMGRSLLESVWARNGGEERPEYPELIEFGNHLQAKRSQVDVPILQEGTVLYQWLATDRRWLASLGIRRLDRIPSDKTADVASLPKKPESIFGAWCRIFESARQGDAPVKEDIESCMNQLRIERPQPLAWPLLTTLYELVEQQPMRNRAAWIPMLQECIDIAGNQWLPDAMDRTLSLKRQCMQLRMRAWQGETKTVSDDFASLLGTQAGNDLLLSQWGAFLRDSAELESTADAKSNALEKAMQRWLAKVKPGSEAWFEAKFRVAGSLVQQGKGKDAQQMWRVLASTYPNIPIHWKNRFEQILEKAR